MYRRTALGQILASVQRIEQKVGQILMGQADINTQVQLITQAVTELGAAVTAIQAEITGLQGQGVDTSGLDAAVAQLGTAVASVQALAPAPPPAPGS